MSSGKADFLIIAGIGLLAYLVLGKAGNASAGEADVTSSGQRIDGAQVFQMAQAALQLLGVDDITPEMLTTIASIESNFDPGAVRQEPQIGDASYGIAQTLLGTASDLYENHGADHYGVPTSDLLLQPEASLYFAGAYLHLLRNWNGEMRDDDFVVAAYNAGPGGYESEAAQRYLARYKARFPQIDFGTSAPADTSSPDLSGGFIGQAVDLLGTEGNF